MARRRTIIGIGEALLAEFPDRVEPGGLAIDIARAAAKLGHRGLPISRLGQDLLANELLTQLEAIGVERSLLQSDPDLPTGRLVVRSIAGARRETLDPRAAFDNMQWDFDLVDVAHEADAVVFGMVAQRGGQSSSVITRFLAECTSALSVCDLTNRPPAQTRVGSGGGDGRTANGGATFSRGRALRSLELAQLAVIDGMSWEILRRGPRDAPHDEAARTLMRGSALAAIVWADADAPIELHTAARSYTASRVIERTLFPTALVGLLHAMLRGDEMERCLESAVRIAVFVRENPDAKVEV